MTGDPSLQEGANVNENGRSRFAAWLPRGQMRNALQLNIEPVDSAVSPDSVTFAGMRQGMGLIVAAALIAGCCLRFAWTMAACGTDAFGAIEPVGRSPRQSSVARGRDRPCWPIRPHRRGWSRLTFPAGWRRDHGAGRWINWPLSWLNIWIVYGSPRCCSPSCWAPTTLQQFYTLTSFAFLPLVLTALGFIPCLGIIVNLVALL